MTVSLPILIVTAKSRGVYATLHRSFTKIFREIGGIEVELCTECQLERSPSPKLTKR
ncbi:MAG: hypothetical protein HC879_21805 [Leptolyngbyaceae cyanobacterium SL_5_9]|nr:hypothetical protein [Leptolyngbyaceae cyanobacterium SL_5_9]NJO75826.1 hypothetical protein [Leptolyngbyaceae cyanobacterium RM1_406_9]